MKHIVAKLKSLVGETVILVPHTKRDTMWYFSNES